MRSRTEIPTDDRPHEPVPDDKHATVTTCRVCSRTLTLLEGRHVHGRRLALL